MVLKWQGFCYRSFEHVQTHIGRRYRTYCSWDAVAPVTSILSPNHPCKSATVSLVSTGCRDFNIECFLPLRSLHSFTLSSRAYAATLSSLDIRPPPPEHYWGWSSCRLFGWPSRATWTPPPLKGPTRPATLTFHCNLSPQSFSASMSWMAIAPSEC